MASPRVYSYRRFSSGRQAHGHSLERQTASARAWCAEHGFELDEDFVLSDLGISAYTGKNATEGALAAFLLAVKNGQVPTGSILLVESLDRLSRSAITDAVALLTSIVRAGIRVVSLIDGKEWNETTINDTVNFIMSVLLFARAHEESATKAKRVRAAFAKKRDAGLPVVTHGHGPGWALPREDRSGWDVDENKAESVRKVFEHVAAGMGGLSIARKANAEAWPLPWRMRANTNTRWEHTQVSRLVRDRRALGEWQPKQMINARLVQLGDPVKNYFPRIVSDDLWGQVQQALAGRSGPKRLRGIKADLLAGLFYCGCGERMERKAASGRGYARYYCIGRKAGITACEPISEKAVVEHGYAFIANLEARHFQPTEALNNIRAAIDTETTKLQELDDRAQRYLDAIEGAGGESRLVAERLRAIEAEQDTVRETISRLREELLSTPKAGAGFAAHFVDEVKAAIEDKTAVTARQHIASALARMLKRVEWRDGWLQFFTTTNMMFADRVPDEARQRAQRWDKGRKRSAKASTKDSGGSPTRE